MDSQRRAAKPSGVGFIDLLLFFLFALTLSRTNRSTLAGVSRDEDMKMSDHSFVISGFWKAAVRWW
jgi:hypothetical protein